MLCPVIWVRAVNFLREIKWHKPDQLPFNVAKENLDSPEVQKKTREILCSFETVFPPGWSGVIPTITCSPAVVSSALRRFASFPSWFETKRCSRVKKFTGLCPDGPLFLRDKTHDKVVITCFYALKATVGFFEFKFFSSINNCSIPANQKPAHAKVKGESYCSSVFHWYLLCWYLAVRYFQLYQSAKIQQNCASEISCICFWLLLRQ